MTNLILVLLIVGIIGGAITKIIAEKKRGAKCVGCPLGKAPSKSCGCNH